MEKVLPNLQGTSGGDKHSSLHWLKTVPLCRLPPKMALVSSRNYSASSCWSSLSKLIAVDARLEVINVNQRSTYSRNHAVVAASKGSLPMSTSGRIAAATLRYCYRRCHTHFAKLIQVKVLGLQARNKFHVVYCIKSRQVLDIFHVYLEKKRWYMPNDPVSMN